MFPPEDFKSESGRFRNLSDGAGFGGIPYPKQIWKPYEVYEDYEVFCPLGDRTGTALGQCKMPRLCLGSGHLPNEAWRAGPSLPHRKGGEPSRVRRAILRSPWKVAEVRLGHPESKRELLPHGLTGRLTETSKLLQKRDFTTLQKSHVTGM